MLEFIFSEAVASFFGFCIGVVAVFIGCLAMFRPGFMSEGFGIPVVGAGEHYVFALGVREVFVGLVALLLWWESLFQQLGVVCLAIAVVALGDFFVVYRHGIKKAAIIHLLGFFASLFFAFYYLLLI